MLFIKHIKADAPMLAKFGMDHFMISVRSFSMFPKILWWVSLIKCKRLLKTVIFKCLLRLIDDGRNPDEYTKDIINKCIQRNQITKGKSEAFKNFRKQLLEDLEQTFPEEIEAYRELRSASAAELKKQSQTQASLPNGDVKVKTEH
ncbi:mediator of RNA polymerase II transcription subunit 10b isoform X2 [Cryptomeria japonica]|uniref:mediator of RNA polymerase II transcription subunit 10b isoform X2 n=1 Tax=Cryptomeria japonica TaxID=3369 RepID=UPI0027DA1F8F|nr:mediator of RNA polymerase II transcription subunit 10b isoform X2 [Cryptomeria japonica]